MVIVVLVAVAAVVVEEEEDRGGRGGDTGVLAAAVVHQLLFYFTYSCFFFPLRLLVATRSCSSRSIFITILRGSSETISRLVMRQYQRQENHCIHNADKRIRLELSFLVRDS